jgi:hypothetical protein
MASRNHRFGIQDIIAVAVLTGTATVLLQSKFEDLAVRLSPALRQVFVEWWPLLLILAGAVLLFGHYHSVRQPRGANSFSAAPRGTHES